MLNYWNKNKIDFILRLKNSLNYVSIEELNSPENAEQKILIDEIIELAEKETAEKYAGRLHKITAYNKKHN